LCGFFIFCDKDFNVNDPINILLWLCGQLILSAAIYGGIRSDIKNMHERLTEAKSLAHDAHKRIDSLLTSRVRKAIYSSHEATD
jgi:hypothetical protein